MTKAICVAIASVLLSGCLTISPSKCLLPLAPVPGEDSEQVINAMHNELSETHSVSRARQNAWLIWYAEYLKRYKSNDWTLKDLVGTSIDAATPAVMGLSIWKGLKSININTDGPPQAEQPYPYQ